MPFPPCLATAFVVSVVMLAGCSGPQAYGIGQAWQREACNRLVDLQERSRCLESTATSYDQYRRESEAAKGGR